MMWTTMTNNPASPAQPRLLGIAAVLLAVGTIVGCPSGDPDSGDGGTGGEGGDSGGPSLPGVRLNCCYELANITPGGPTEIEIGCTYNSNSPCVDESDPEIDTNGDGALNAQERRAACAMKCPDDPADGFKAGPFHVYGNPNVGIELESPFQGCFAVEGNISQTALSCDPGSPGHLAPWNKEVPPSHEGTFSSGTSGNEAEVVVNGMAVEVDYQGQFEFAIFDCVTVRTQQVCYLDLQRLDIELLGNPSFGGYEVDGAALDLAIRQATTVTFNCTTSACFGTFDFSDRTGTAISLNLSWDQTTTSSGSIGGGGLLLSNGREGLGGLTRVMGELEMDASKSTGKLRLRGSGEDRFGGDFASASFDITGLVSRYTR